MFSQAFYGEAWQEGHWLDQPNLIEVDGFTRQLNTRTGMETNPNDVEPGLPNLSKLANADESALAVDENPDVEKPAGAAELMTPDNAPGPDEN
ncbi:hypothetical protein A6C57_13595 [Fibrella sp. ES10-3-2-2]|nr:hypothetical protein A6C57_13595 [Fibrella sp. ES10-3-2-2]